VHVFEQFTYLLFSLEPVQVVDAGDLGLGWGEDDAFDLHVGVFDVLTRLFDVWQVVNEDGDLVTFTCSISGDME